MTNLDDFADQIDPILSTVSLAGNEARHMLYGTKPQLGKSSGILTRMDESHPTASSTTRRTHVDRIGLMINSPISYISDYLADAMIGIAASAETQALNVMLYTGLISNPDAIHRVSRAHEIDGAILFWSSGIDPTIDILLEENIPFVVLGRRVNHPSVSYISPDNVGGTYSAIRHLIALGHRRIGFMTRAELGTTNADRLAGFSAAMNDCNIAIDETLIVATRIEPDSGYHAMHQLLDLPNPPTAVFAFDDMVAQDALRAAIDRGCRIPEDVAVVGFGGLRSSMTTSPGITTLGMPLQSVGSQAVELLLKLISVPDSPAERRIVPVNLIIRASTIGES